MSLTHPRARVAALSRSRQPNDPELVEARRELREQKLAQFITRAIDEAPPLSSQQRERLAALLRPEPARVSGLDQHAKRLLAELDTLGGPDAAA